MIYFLPQIPSEISQEEKLEGEEDDVDKFLEKQTGLIERDKDEQL